MKMFALYRQTILSKEYKIENINSKQSMVCQSWVRVLVSLTFCALVCGVHSQELQINRNRGRVITVSERIANDNYDILSNSRSNWWQKTVDKKPTLVVNDEPIGTGVPIWKEVDIYGSEVRKGRSYAYKADNSSVDNRLIRSIFVITALNIFLYF